MFQIILKPKQRAISVVCLVGLLPYTAYSVYSAISEGILLKSPKNYKNLRPAEQDPSGDSKRPFVCGLPILADATTSIGSPERSIDQLRKGRSDEVGDIRTFFAVEFAAEGNETVEVVARAEKKGEHAYIYVDTTAKFDDGDLSELLRQFDNQIYDTNRGAFGSEPKPGIDGDDRITLLFLDIKEAESLGQVVGYFRSRNQFPKNQISDSNEREMLYIDIVRLQSFGVESILSVIAHEFQHLIHWNHDSNENTWLNEGLSEYAAHLNGFPSANPPAMFLADPDVGLTVWSNRTSDYSRVFLWSLYLAEQFGSAFIRELIADTENGLPSVQNALSKQGQRLTVQEVFARWVVANYLDLDSTQAPEYGYAGLELPALTPSQTFGFLPVGTRTVTVSRYGADYYVFTGGEDLVIRLDGSDAEQFFAAKVLKIRESTAVISDFPLDAFQDGELAVPEFSGQYDRIVLIPYVTSDLDASPAAEPFAQYMLSADGMGGVTTFVDTLSYHDRSSNTVIPLGLPSPLINDEHYDAYAVRFTPKSDGLLIGAEFAVWRRSGSGGRVRFYLYGNRNLGSIRGVPSSKRDSVDLVDVSGVAGTITWNSVDFSSNNIPLVEGQDFHLGWEVLEASAGDTIVAILDTARVSTDRSSVHIRERGQWSHFVGGINFFMKAIVTVQEDLSTPELSAGILQNPVFSDAVDVFVLSPKALNQASVEGSMTIGSQTATLTFRTADDSNKVFVDDTFRLTTAGAAQLVVWGRNKFGTVVSGDTLNLNIENIGKTGGQLRDLHGDFVMTIPPEALTNDQFFTVYSTEENHLLHGDSGQSYDNHYPAVGLSFTVGPINYAFDSIAELRIRYDGSNVALLSENNLAIAYLDGDRWVVLGGELFREQKTISVLVDRTGSYSLVIRESAHTGSNEQVPQEFFLQQNYPNPFNPRTTISFGLPTERHTIFRIINLKGQTIATLLDEVLLPGEHIVEWDGNDDHGVPVASGVYLYQIRAESFVETRKLVLVK